MRDSSATRRHHRTGLGGRRCGHGRALSRESGFANGLLGQSEVENLYPTVLGDEDVVGLQIAMDDAFVVRCGQSLLGHAALRQRTGVHLFTKRLAFKQLQVVQATLRAPLVNCKNVGMVDRAEHAGFVLKAL